MENSIDPRRIKEVNDKWLTPPTKEDLEKRMLEALDDVSFNFANFINLFKLYLERLEGGKDEKKEK